MTRPWERLLGQLVHERYGSLVGWATLVCGSPEDARAVLDDALAATFAGRARFATLADAEQHVRRAVATRSVGAAGRPGRPRTSVWRAERLAPPPARGVAGHHAPADVVRALAGLTPRERACVVLRHLDGLGVRETAGLLAMSDGAVERCTADGLARLDAALGGVTAAEHETLPVHPVTRGTATGVER